MSLAPLQSTLRQLKLSGLAASLEVRLQEAAGHQLGHAEFLEILLQDEVHVRADRRIERRVKAAGFRDRKNLDDFDWSFIPTLPKKQVFDLAAGRYLKEARDVLWLGPPGVGKSHLVQALGLCAIRQGRTVLYRSVFDAVRDFLHDDASTGPLGLGPAAPDKLLQKYLKPDLLILDDMGMKQLPKRSGEYLFEIVMRRYETRSTMMTSNRPLEDWGKLLGDVPSATAILDRFLHHATILQLQGRSYRLRSLKEAGPEAGQEAGKEPERKVGAASDADGKAKPTSTAKSSKKSVKEEEKRPTAAGAA